MDTAFLKRYWLCIVIFVLALGYALLANDALMVDEIPHHEQAAGFAGGNWSVNPDLTVIPGYHVVLASLSLMTGWSSIPAFRLFTLIFSLLAVGIFFLLAKELRLRHVSIKTLQFFFFPLLFPFFFLLYTDVLSLLLVLALVYFALRKQYVLSGLFGLLSCVVRQNNILWVAFVLVVSYVSEYGWQPKKLVVAARTFWAYILTGALFVGYVFINGDVSFGDTTAHPSFSFHLTNVWFLLFLSCFLFLPLLYAYRGELLSLMKKRLFWMGVGALLLVFSFTFVNTHPYNVDWGEYFLRNNVLIFFSSAWWWKLVFFIPVVLAAMLFSVVPLKKQWWLLYPFTFLFLVPSWLVEQRYYIIPLSLFLLVKKEERRPLEYAQLLWFVLWSITLFLVISSGRLFL